MYMYIYCDDHFGECEKKSSIRNSGSYDNDKRVYVQFCVCMSSSMSNTFRYAILYRFLVFSYHIFLAPVDPFYMFIDKNVITPTWSKSA